MLVISLNTSRVSSSVVITKYQGEFLGGSSSGQPMTSRMQEEAKMQHAHQLKT